VQAPEALLLFDLQSPGKSHVVQMAAFLHNGDAVVQSSLRLDASLSTLESRVGGPGRSIFEFGVSQDQSEKEPRKDRPLGSRFMIGVDKI
jgi:hypothetical protein